MAGKIFISYRRADTADFTVALYNELCEWFGEEAIFKDINDIPPGTQFSEVLHAALEESSVVLVVIGPGWISTSGERLFQPTDWVRLEIAASLERNLRVVPVLVNGAQLPSLSELPEDLHPLRSRQASTIHNSSFEDDVRRLARGIQDSVPLRPDTMGVAAGPPSGDWASNVFKAIIFLIILAGIAMVMYAWMVSDGELQEKGLMSLFGASGIVGGYTAYSRQRWLELRERQLQPPGGG